MSVKIPIVEDDAFAAMMMEYVLDRVGWYVQASANAEKAHSLAHAGNFDPIILDINLPEPSGFEMCRRLKENPRLHHTPVIFASGRPHIEDRQSASELGAVDYIQKPFDVTDFIFRITSRGKTGSRRLDVLDEDTNPDTQGLGNPPQGNQ